MKKIIKLVGEKNDLELGYVEDGTYYETGLLKDDAHSWKILQWIDTELQAEWKIQVVARNQIEKEDMMDESKRKNKEALRKIVEWAFRNWKD